MPIGRRRDHQSALAYCDRLKLLSPQGLGVATLPLRGMQVIRWFDQTYPSPMRKQGDETTAASRRRSLQSIDARNRVRSLYCEVLTARLASLTITLAPHSQSILQFGAIVSRFSLSWLCGGNALARG